MAYCTVCEFTPGHCGFDPVVCDAIKMSGSGGVPKQNIKTLSITSEIMIHDRSAGYIIDMKTHDYGIFKTKAEAVKYIEDLCDKYEIR